MHGSCGRRSPAPRLGPFARHPDFLSPRLFEDRRLPARFDSRRHRRDPPAGQRARVLGRRDRRCQLRLPTSRSRRYKAVVFLSTTGDVLNAAQEAAFERFIRRGGGFVGVHSATDTEYDWPFYGALVGAYFAGHPDIQNATIQIEDAAHPVDGVAAARVDAPRRVVQLPAESPRAASTCLPRSTSAPTPAARWRRTTRLSGRTPTRAGGRSTPPLGHTQESFSETPFVDHLGRAILWAAGAI